MKSAHAAHIRQFEDQVNQSGKKKSLSQKVGEIKATGLRERKVHDQKVDSPKVVEGKKRLGSHLVLDLMFSLFRAQ